MAFVYIPNGVIQSEWNPTKVGTDFDLKPTLEPLAPLRQHIQVLSGLEHDKARANGDGPGDHARANATFLTGCQARKTSGSDIRVGPSVDQIAAQAIGHLTPLPSLEISCDRSIQSGACDSGYSCAYQYNISWKTETMPVASENNPRAVFERLFGDGSSVSAQFSAFRQAQKKSLLDYVVSETADLKRKLDHRDKDKLDEFLTSVREIERRISRAESFQREVAKTEKPTGIPKSYRDHLRVMFDMLALSFHSDSTRIATFLMAHDGSNRSFREIGVSDGHHYLSHHQNDQAKIDRLKKIDRFYVEEFSRFLQTLASMKVGSDSLLDHSMIVLGGGIGDGNRHSHHDLPVILAGKGGGSITPGRHVTHSSRVPMTNLYLSMLDRMGVPAERIGDSTGRLETIA